MKKRYLEVIFSVAMVLCAIGADTVVPSDDANLEDSSAALISEETAQPSNPQTAKPSNIQAVKPPNMPKWKTPTWSLVARGMDLRTALDTFAVAQGLSVVMSDQVCGVFSADFRDVPCEEFLERISAAHNLTWYYDGSALFIYGAGDIRTLLLDLRYMKAGEVRALLAELGVEDARFPLRTASNDEIIMVSGPPRYVSLVSELIAKADKLREMRTFNEVDVRLFPLKHTWADDVTFNIGTYYTTRTGTDSAATIRGVANLVQEIMNGDRSRTVLEGEMKEGEDPKEFALRRSQFQPIVRAENRLNAILVKDVKSRMPVYERVIKDLDVPQKLVEISVTVVEMSKGDALDWQLSLSLQGTHGHTAAGIGQNASNQFGPSGIGSMGLAGALTHIHSNYSLAASLTALREKGKARNISRTSLLTVNNMAAQLTDQQSYHARIIGNEVATLQEVSAGTRLIIKPRVIDAESTNEVTQVWLTMELQDGGFETLSVDSMPMSRASTLQTQTAVAEGDSIMLAGYLRDIEEEAGWGIPYLRDIPLIGWLFGGASVRKETVQRIFIFTPYVIDLDTENLSRVQSTRLRDISLEEDLETDAEESDLTRKRRELEKNEIRAINRERAEEEYNRRAAEIKHGRNLRKINRERKMRLLSEDVEEWKQQEEDARLRAIADETPHPVPEDDTPPPPPVVVEPAPVEVVEPVVVEPEPAPVEPVEVEDEAPVEVVEPAPVEEEKVSVEDLFDRMQTSSAEIEPEGKSWDLLIQ